MAEAIGLDRETKIEWGHGGVVGGVQRCVCVCVCVCVTLMSFDRY